MFETVFANAAGLIHRTMFQLVKTTNSHFQTSHKISLHDDPPQEEV